MKKIGTVIRKSRREKEISQEKLSELLGLYKSQVHHWEKHRESPNGTNLLLAMRFLKLKVEDFFEDEEEKKNE